MKKFTCKTEMWLYPAETAAWHFVTIDKKVSEEIRGLQKVPRRGFGSVRIEAAIGKTTWKTSIFPDKKLGAYVLPIKSQVRKLEGIQTGDIIKISFILK